MRMLFKGVVLEQQKSFTIEKRLRKLLQPDHYNNTIVCLDPENETILKAVTPAVLQAAAEGCRVFDKIEGLPLAEKLRQMEAGKTRTLVIDAIDDQPYVTSSMAVILCKQKAFLLAVECLRKAYKLERVILATYARGVYAGIRLPKEYAISWKKLYCRYPARPRLRAMYPEKDGKTVILGAETMLHLYRALFNAKVQDSTIVTVAGTAVGAPCNVEVTAGTPVSQLLELCNLNAPAVLVRGGAMTGTGMLSVDDQTVRLDDTAFLAFSEPVRMRTYECVGCGRCSHVCPMGLLPDTLYKNAAAGIYNGCAYLKIDRCIECGCCSYICPSNVDILHYIRKAKRVLEEREDIPSAFAVEDEFGAAVLPRDPEAPLEKDLAPEPQEQPADEPVPDMPEADKSEEPEAAEAVTEEKEG